MLYISLLRHIWAITFPTLWYASLHILQYHSSQICSSISESLDETSSYIFPFYMLCCNALLDPRGMLMLTGERVTNWSSVCLREGRREKGRPVFRTLSSWNVSLAKETFLKDTSLPCSDTLLIPFNSYTIWIIQSLYKWHAQIVT